MINQLSQSQIVGLNQDKKEKSLCPVCQQNVNQVYHVAKCSHTFCQDCSIGYISSQANHFAQAKCLQEGCNAPLEKELPIYQLLDEKTTHRLKQFETYKFLQANPNYTSCKIKDCPGTFKIKSIKCQLCKAKHCRKCLNLRHEGGCKLSQQQKEMKKLHYQKCPSCRVWVQRKQGCNYINCKCGMEFCYRCGSDFDKDPCRKRQNWSKQAIIRQLMNKLPNFCCKSTSDALLFFPRVLVLVMVWIPLVIGLWILPMIFMFFFVECLLIFYAVPVLFCQLIAGVQNCFCRFMLFLLMICTFPVFVPLCSMAVAVIFLIYPFARRCVQSNIFDYFDGGVSTFSIHFLNAITSILSCLMCQ